MRTKMTGILIRILRSHFGNGYIEPDDITMLNRELPDTVTEEEVQSLGERLCQDCTAFPTTEIIKCTWHRMYEKTHGTKQKALREFKEDAKPLKDKIDYVKESLNLFPIEESDNLTLESFARLSLPGITDEEIKRNKPMIQFVMAEQRRERLRRSPVHTTMRLKDGWIYEWVQLLA